LIIKYFLVGIFCVAQPYDDCIRVAGERYFDTKESCELAAQSFGDMMMAQNPTNTIAIQCVDAYPIKLNQDV
jgi:hypothetical protein